MTVNWGVIGAGGIANKKTIPAINKAKNARLEALMVRDLERAKRLADKHGAKKYYDNMRELLKDKEIDAVYIATPVYLHCEHTLQAAEQGKHILCEKPMAMTVEECRKMIDACKANGVKLMIGFMMRFHSSHQKIKELLDKEVLGRIIEVRAQLHLWYPDAVGSWRQDPRLGGGGSLMDVGTHCLDLLRFFVGEPVKIMAMVDTIAFSYPVEDTATLIVKFENRVQGIVDACFDIPHRENLLELYGTEGTILAFRTIGPFENPEVRLITAEGVKELNIPYVDRYKAEIEHFDECIENNLEPSISGKDGLRNIQLIMAAYESARSGRAVEVYNLPF